MKFKFIALLAIVAAFGIGGVSSASAGNCTGVGNTGTYWTASTNKLYFNGYVGQCTSVNRVQIGVNPPGNADAFGYWHDNTDGLNHEAEFAASSSGGTLQTSPGSGTITWSFNITPWCAHQNHYVLAQFTYRIESIDIHGVKTWGPWHSVGYPLQFITC